MSCAATDEDRATRGSVADIVSGDTLKLVPVVGSFVVQRDDDDATGHSLGDSVLSEPDQLELETVDAPGAKALSRFSGKAGSNALVLRHPFTTVKARDLSGDRCAHASIAVLDAEHQGGVLARLDGVLTRFENAGIQRTLIELDLTDTL